MDEKGFQEKVCFTDFINWWCEVKQTEQASHLKNIYYAIFSEMARQHDEFIHNRPSTVISCAINITNSNGGSKPLNKAQRRSGLGVFIEIGATWIPPVRVPAWAITVGTIGLRAWGQARPSTAGLERANQTPVVMQISRDGQKALGLGLSKQNVPTTRPGLIGALNPLSRHNGAKRGDSFVSTYAGHTLIFFLWRGGVM